MNCLCPRELPIFGTGYTCMPDLILVLMLMMILALMVWRFALGVASRGETAAPRPHYNHALQRRFRILERACAGVIAENGFATGSDEVCLSDGRSRAKLYLRRIVALTSATQTGNGYILDVGRTRFRVRDGYVGRLRDASDPKCEYEKTCFRLPYNCMPKAEQIATALLQLKNNPGLFDRWAAQCGAYKADGQGFSCAQ